MKSFFLILFTLATASFCFSQDNVGFNIEKKISELNIERSEKADIYFKQTRVSSNSSNSKLNFNEINQKYNQPKYQQKQQRRDKIFNLMKSLNQNEFSEKTAKLDSIVEFDVKTVPVLDSTLISSKWEKLDNDGLIIERIITTYDSILGEQKSKTEYNYSDPGGETRTSFSWDSALNQWVCQGKVEYGQNEQGLVTLFATFDCIDNDFIPDFKFISEYNKSGKIVSCARLIWDVALNDWITKMKSECEYNEIDDLTQRINYQNIDEFGLKPSSKTIVEYDSFDGVTTTLYSWNLYNEEYEFLSEKYVIHHKEFDENGNITFEFYEDFETPITTWEKRYWYDENGRIQHIEYKDQMSLYEWIHHYEYDEFGNQVFYLEEEYDSITSSMVEKELIAQEYNDEGRILYRDTLVRNDSLERLELMRGLIYTYSDQNRLQSINVRSEVDGVEIVNSISNYTYNSDLDYTFDEYSIVQTGFQTINEVDEILIFGYDEEISRYTSISYKESYNDSAEIHYYIDYDEHRNINSLRFFDDSEMQYRCFYDQFGRDSLWAFDNSNDTLLRYYNTFSYVSINPDSLILTQRFYDPETSTQLPETENIYYYSNNLLKHYEEKRLNQNLNQLELINSPTFHYNINGQIQTITHSLYGNYKTEYNLSSDTLLIKHLSFNDDSNTWQLNSTELLKVDTSFIKGQIQKIPTQFFDEECAITFSFEWYSLFDYGKINSYEYYNSLNDSLPGYVTNYYYSETSPMIGNGIISGYVYEDSNKQQKSINITSANAGISFSNASIKLIEETDEFVLSSTTSNSDGYFEFNGIPIGNYYLRIEIPGYEQKDAYHQKISLSQQKFANQNFIVGNNENFTNLNNLNDSKIIIYPNPTTGKLQIKGLPQNETTIVSIYNVMGQKLIKKELNKQNSIIDLSSYMKGPYFLLFNNSSKSAVKIIKE